MTRISLLPVLGLLAGCSLMLGDTYHRVDPLPGTMGAIYIYSGEVTPLQNIYVDTNPETTGATHSITMVKNGYYPYVAAPGLVRVVNATGSCVMISVTSGSHHWVRVSNTEPQVAAVDQKTGEAEIGGHRALGRDNVARASGDFPADPCPLVE